MSAPCAPPQGPQVMSSGKRCQFDASSPDFRLLWTRHFELISDRGHPTPRLQGNIRDPDYTSSPSRSPASGPALARLWPSPAPPAAPVGVRLQPAALPLVLRSDVCLRSRVSAKWPMKSLVTVAWRTQSCCEPVQPDSVTATAPPARTT